MRERAFSPATRDLDDPGEVTEMVRRFYSDVAQDDLLGPIFNTVARVDWSEHLPKLTDYWCRSQCREGEGALRVAQAHCRQLR